MRIGELAAQARVSVQTVRYYERRGLLSRAERSRSGYRQYSPASLERVDFIRRAQGLGFTLAEIAQLLALRLDPQRGAGKVKLRVAAKLADVEQRIRELQRIRDALAHLANRCRGGGGNGSVADCPLLDAMGAPNGATDRPTP